MDVFSPIYFLQIEKEAGTKHVIFLFERSQRKTGTALQRDSGFSYAHMNGCFYTYVPASFIITRVRVYLHGSLYRLLLLSQRQYEQRNHRSALLLHALLHNG